MGETNAININDFNRCQGLPKIYFPMVRRLSCGQENTYSAEKLEDRRDSSVITAKESDEKDSELSPPEDTTEVQETNKGADSCLPLTLLYGWTSHNSFSYQWWKSLIAPLKMNLLMWAMTHWNGPPKMFFFSPDFKIYCYFHKDRNN